MRVLHLIQLLSLFLFAGIVPFASASDLYRPVPSGWQLFCNDVKSMHQGLSRGVSEVKQWADDNPRLSTGIAVGGLTAGAVAAWPLIAPVVGVKAIVSVTSTTIGGAFSAFFSDRSTGKGARASGSFSVVPQGNGYSMGASFGFEAIPKFPPTLAKP